MSDSTAIAVSEPDEKVVAERAPQPAEFRSAEHRVERNVEGSRRRRVLLWGCALLAAAMAVRALRPFQPAVVAPRVRFERFVDNLRQQLPAALFGEDLASSFPVAIEARFEPPYVAHPTHAQIRFEQQQFSEKLGLFVTAYAALYERRRGSWHCADIDVRVSHRGFPLAIGADLLDDPARRDAGTEEIFVEIRKRMRLARLRTSKNATLGRLLRECNDF